ncbi:FKBP-type peptidyl-prolyl cis-trans isomerase [Thiosocius teredinicola]|uniref:FKBP-type peptidyl-prolyl cis-trans isomerase n=1 Tax=Thiosocius teredinicola TaxID=1973002 RepID=UPI000990F850
MKRVFFVLLMWSLSGLVVAADEAGLSVSERYSYAMGVRLGQLLKGQGVRDLDSKAFAAAIDDVLADRPLRLSETDMVNAIREQQQQFAQQRDLRAAENLKAGQAYLTENAGKADIVVLPSGLQYRVLESGKGAQPQPTSTVRVHYHGTLIDGTVFDSSVDRGEPAEFPVGGVIPGFREALSLMHVGDRWQVFVPSTLAYGEQGAGADIGPNETLIFELSLLDIVK